MYSLKSFKIVQDVQMKKRDTPEDNEYSSNQHI